MGRCRFVALLLAMVWATASSAFADDLLERRRQAANQFKPGDKVEVLRLGKAEQGVVTKIDEFGRVHVETPRFKNGWPYQPEKVRRPAGKTTKPNAESSSEDDANPFVTADEKQGTAEKRTWTDRSGKFQVDARLLRFDEENVILLREDGQELNVPRAKLSDTDQALLLQLSSGDSANDVTAPADNAGDLVDVDYSAATPLDLGSITSWKYVPDPAVGDGRSGRIVLPPRRDVFDQVDTLLVPSSEMAYVVIVNKRYRDTPARILACDLVQNKLVESGDFFAHQVPLDVSPDQGLLLARNSAAGFGKHGALSLHRLDGFQVQPIASWYPSTNQGASQDVQWAKFVDAEHVMTLSQRGQLSLWNVANGIHQLYIADAGSAAAVTFSANRKVAVVRTEHGLAFIRPLTGETIGFIQAGDSTASSNLALRPDGKRLALADGGGRIRVWDLTTGELEREFFVPHGLHLRSHPNALAWADDDRLITQHGDLIDVNLRIRLWTYTGIDAPVFNLGESVWSVTKGNGDSAPVISGIKLPHGDALRTAENLDPDSLLAIRPGTKVALKLDFSGTKAEKERVRKVLTERLRKAGMEVVPQSTILLTATVKPGDQETVHYREFGSFKTSEHTVELERLELAYIVSGEPVWTYISQGWTPHLLQLQKGETIDQALVRVTRQDISVFEYIVLPRYVASSPSGRGYGSSPWPGN